jgi:Zn finger protein HypA/HybF involved in hydrogenase expression
MHELRLASEICRIAETHAGPAGAAAIREVAVDVGDTSGVEPESLTFCLEVLLSQPPFAAARPRLFRLSGDELRVRYVEVDDGRPDH